MDVNTKTNNIQLFYFYEKHNITVREHPFNLKGWAIGFWGKTFLSANVFETKFLSLKWAEKNLLALCALKKYCFCRKSCREKKILLRCEAKKMF